MKKTQLLIRFQKNFILLSFHVNQIYCNDFNDFIDFSKFLHSLFDRKSQI